jgi:hypothetical protein
VNCFTVALIVKENKYIADIKFYEPPCFSIMLLCLLFWKLIMGNVFKLNEKAVK